MSLPETQTNTTFGSYLRFLRRRARLTQTELGIAVGYSPGQISMLENGQRTPSRSAVAALFVAALGVEHDDPRRRHLLALADAATPARGAAIELVVDEAALVVREELGELEDLPWVPAYAVRREAALAQLRAWLGRDRRVALCGLAGMGKSTLAAQFAAEQGPGVFWMTCTDAASLAPETVLRQLALFAATRVAAPQRVAAVIRRPQAGDPPIPYPQQLATVAAALAELAAPLLVFDDAQLFNRSPQMLQLLARLLALAPGCRLLLVTREEIELPGLLHLNLGGLEPAELVLLRDRLSSGPAPDLDYLQRQTGGSPMLLRLAISCWEQQDGSPAAVPASISDYLVETTLRSLAPPARRLLDLLAIWRGPLDLTSPQLAAQLAEAWGGYEHQAALVQLRRSRLIEQPAQAAPHPLLREPLLAAITVRPDDCRQLHQTAAALATACGDSARAAHHLAMAGDLLAAQRLLVAQASAQAPLSQGLGLAAAADELLDLLRPRQRADPRQWGPAICALLVVRGDLLVNTTRADDAQASYYEALALTRSPYERARLTEKIALCAYRRGAFEEALTLCDQAGAVLGLGVAAEAIRLRIQIGATRMRVLMTLARFDEAQQICETALALVRPLALFLPGMAGAVRASANLALGYVARFRGDNDLARQHLHKSAQQAHAVGAAEVEIDALQYLSCALRDIGDMPGAEEVGQRALELASAAGNEYLVSSILHHLSLTDYYRADLERALWRTHQVLQLKTPMGDIEGAVASRLVQALTLSAQGAVEAAQACARQAARDCDLLENSWLRGVADYGLAVVLSFSEDQAGAERYALRALATEMLKRDVQFYSGVQVYLGMIYVAQGRLAEAEAIIAPELAPGAGHSAELLRELVRGMWLLGSGRPGEASACAEALVRRAERVGYHIYAHEARRLAALSAAPPALADLPRLVCCPPVAP